jgi:hypothetical protein
MVHLFIRGDRLFIFVLFAGFIGYYVPKSHAAMLQCDQNTAAGVNCSCELRSLRPLQGAIGMGEVLAKADKIRNKPDKAMRKLEDDPVKVVRGPGENLYVTDHHHGARAWLEAGYASSVCIVQDVKVSQNLSKFWEQLREHNWVRLADKNGAAIPPDDLPKSLELLPDDPYRTLAYLVRKNGGFCRGLMERKEFAEFVWADWLRGRDELSALQVAAAPEETLPAALKLVESSAASNKPGYRGDKPADYACPADDEP